jgi:hypothetical protein
MMRKLSRLTVFALTGVLASSLQSQVAASCRPPDEKSSGIIAELRDWVTTNDLERIKERDRIFKIPVVNPAEISVVVNDRICKKAIEGYSKLPGGMRPARLYVIRMGSKYFAVHDPTDKAGDMMTVHIMDRKFKSIGGWTGP